jgi:riboflavin synthase
VFTGIVQAIGTVAALERSGVDGRLRVHCGSLDVSDLHEGDSVCVNGVCLTAMEMGDAAFSADVSAETLMRTTLGALAAGSRVNLEKSLLPTTRLGGHLVSGHVDGVGKITEFSSAGRSQNLRVEVPAELMRYIVPKGSVCVDGVSLTVNEADGREFSVNLIPHTLEATICSAYEAGTAVNIEVDIIARYLEGLLRDRNAPPSRIDRTFLARHGYIHEA